jgi:hypothetical protein
MSQIKREAANKPNDISGGPHLAKVIGHLDPSFMGGLEVTLLRSDGNTIGEATETYSVRYCSPFFGATPFEFQGFNKDDYNDTQKSYGMWFIPPDIGVTVMIFFIDGDPSKGYWMGCVPDRFANHMVPAIATSGNVAFAEGESELYDTSSVPVAEVNRRAYGDDLENNTEIDKVKKPVHPFAEHLLEEGTLEDDIRGVSYSTSRRNVPSSVYGILTPGPLDRRPGAKKSFIGKTQSQSPAPVPVSRLGGSQFVMDDGDDRYQRRTNASEGPPDYADLLDGDSGEPEIPSDEYIRLRTRTGHQLLLHNSEDLIYIGNSRGTSWIELSSDGKIDIFAEDSVSIHTKQDFNFYADRDFNFEAGRNINMKASAVHPDGGGNFRVDTEANTRFFVKGDTKITTEGEVHIATLMDNHITSVMNNNFKSILSTYVQSSLDTHIKAGTSMNVQAGTSFDLKSGAAMQLTAGGSGSFGAADLTFSGGSIDLNGPAAPDASSASTATAATPTLALGVNGNVVINPSEAEWVGARYNTESPLESIMFRIPMHEPWPNHENKDPLSVKPELTDREQAGGGEDGAPAGGGEEDGGEEDGGEE